MPRLFVDNLCAIDCSILHPNRGLIGASWSVNIELYGELDEQSMVFDFSKVKKTIKQVIDLEIDHKLLVPKLFDGCNVRRREDYVEIEFTDSQQQTILHQSPPSAICVLPAVQTDRTAVIAHLKRACSAALPSSIETLEISLLEETSAGHYYSYSHGLKKHDGNCQRIAHGHRSQIQIWQDGERAPHFEKKWAAYWRDVYVGTVDDVIDLRSQRIQFSYRSDQGKFMLELPAERVHLMSNDTTVECIAEHIRSHLESEHPGSSIRVKAFEGIGKGAIA